MAKNGFLLMRLLTRRGIVEKHINLIISVGYKCGTVLAKVTHKDFAISRQGSRLYPCHSGGVYSIEETG
jgi:hypothetical protein